MPQDRTLQASRRLFDTTGRPTHQAGKAGRTMSSPASPGGSHTECNQARRKPAAKRKAKMDRLEIFCCCGP